MWRTVATRPDQANVIKIAAADVVRVPGEKPDAGGYGISLFDGDNDQVYKYDGTLRCGMDPEASLEHVTEELKPMGIDVSAGRKSRYGLVHISVCRASTGALNACVRERGSLSTQPLGYWLLATREMIQVVRSTLSSSRQVGIAARAQPAGSIAESGSDPIPMSC